MTGSAIDLERILTGWLNWYKLRRAARWWLQGLIGGLAVSLAISLHGVLNAWLLRGEFIRMTVFIVGAGALGMAAAAYIWPVPRLKAARYFDLKFGLNERISTALELGQESPPPNLYGGLVERQLQDALLHASTVDPRLHLPLRVETSQVLAIMMLLIGFISVWLGGTEQFLFAQHQRAVAQSINQEISQVEAIQSQIETDPDLDQDQRQVLLQPLEEATNQLDFAHSMEQAVAILSSAEQKLRSLEDERAGQVGTALKAAAADLHGEGGNPLEQFTQSLSDGRFQTASQELNQVGLLELTSTEAQELANKLEEAASALESAHAGLAQQLREAAQSLRDGDNERASAALSEAARTLSESSRQIAQSSAAGKAASQLSQGQQRLIQSGQGQLAQAQIGSDSAGQAGQGTGTNGTQGGTGATQGSSSQGNSTAGSGRGEGELGGDAGEASSEPIGTDNSPGDGGERLYEQIYAPQLLGGEDAVQVTLPESGFPGDQVSGPINTAPGSPAPVSVPYIEVYPAYAETYRKALEAGEIPLSLRPLIRNYFSSLEP